MQNTSFVESSSGSGNVQFIDHLAAVLCNSSAERVESEPLGAEIGQILLELSEAVNAAKIEAERERKLRMALELENACMRAGSVGTLPSDSSLVSDSSVYGDMSLSDCLAIVTALPHPELVYISYYDSGMQELDWSTVSTIYKPCDFAHLSFVVLNSFRALVPTGFIPFTLEGLQSLLSPSVTTPVVSSCPLEDSEEAPRMNLLEALNVQSEADCARIVTVRKCHKLGFKSHVHLRQYFSKFGRVDRVVLLPMRAKPKNAMDGRGNRPSSMGFVVMEAKEGADRILSCNNYSGIHEIKGWPIEVRNFVKPADKPDV